MGTPTSRQAPQFSSDFFPITSGDKIATYKPLVQRGLPPSFKAKSKRPCRNPLQNSHQRSASQVRFESLFLGLTFPSFIWCIACLFPQRSKTKARLRILSFPIL